MVKALQCEQDSPQAPSPFKDGIGIRGLASSQQYYLGKPMAVLVGCGKTESSQSLSRRIREKFPHLSRDVCDKIAHDRSRSLKRVSNCVEAIKDCLMSSSPDLIEDFWESPEYKKLIHWAYSLAAHRSDRVTKEWKKFSQLLKWMALRSETQKPEIPGDFPGFHGSWKEPELPPFWCRLLPWLGPVTIRGVQNKAEATRLSHLTSSRGFPAGDKATRRESLEKHSRTLHSRPQISETRRKILERLSYFVGDLCQRRSVEERYRSNGHLSLTSSASLDTPVKEGGRVAEVGVKLRHWLTTRPENEVVKSTWFSRSYWEVPELERWKTMCRSKIVHEVQHEAGESDDRVELDFDNFKLSDPIFGLDGSTGDQILQWAIQEGHAQGCLEGSVWYNPYRPLRLGKEIPCIRPSAIGEPGAKSRVVTVAEDWLTILLQPWCHHIIGMLKLHPSATSGLTRGWQLYEWVKRLKSVSRPSGQVYFLSSDLTTATDFCTHEYSLAMLEGFHRGIGRTSDRYFGLCAELLCSPRRYEGEAVKEFFDVPTSRGILMGDPGAKAVLTLHNLCAEYESLLRFQWDMLESSDEAFFERLRLANGVPQVAWRHFVCSGDDHFGQGPKDYLARISRCHDSNGMSVSWPQNFLSSVGGFYCEEMLLTVGLRDDQIWKVDIPLRDRRYEEQPHIDAMKVRLFSPCAKEHEGKDEPNPAIGKARQMHGMLAWLGGGWSVFTPIFSARWENRMERFLPSGPHRYLPVQLGGIEAPAYHLSMTDCRNVLRSMTAGHAWAIQQVLDGSASPLLRRALASFATNARARGISSDLIEDQVKETLQLADLVGGVDDATLQSMAGVETPQWRDLRWRDKVHIAKRMGLVTVDDAINVIGRPYLFRDMLYPEMSVRHGIDPYRTEQYEAVPWALRQRRHLDNIQGAISFPQSGFTSLSEDTIQRLAEWCVENKPLDIPREVYFFPEAVVVHENLATLRVPL